ncbi:hypothetical protein GCM10028775_25440 [Catellatospora paridis]
MPMLEFAVTSAIDELLSLTAEEDEDCWWDLVWWLQGHGGRHALDAASRLSGHPEPSHRQAAADILCQLGAGPGRAPLDSPYRDEALALLLSMVEREHDPQVLNSITVGFGHLGDERCLASLSRLHTHPDVTVREGVVFGLLRRPEAAALDLLITLSSDSAPEVRYWATFGLGQQTEQDLPRLRDSLAARLADDDPDTLAEAVNGLALRGDERAMPALLAALELPARSHGVDLTTEALYAMAATTADPRLYPHLLAHRDDWLQNAPDEELPEELLAALARYATTGETG